MSRVHSCKWIPLFFVAMLPTGCGLGEYENKIEDQRDLLTLGENAKKLLGPSLDTSTLQRDEGTLVSLYIRGPKGVSSSPKEERYKDVLSQYSGSTTRMYLATAVKGKNLEVEVLSVLPRTTPDSQLDFKVIELSPPPGGKPQQLRRYIFEYAPEGEAKVIYYMYVTPEKDLAVVYEQFAAAGSEVDAAREMSLLTFGVGSKVSRRRQFYSKF